MTLSESNVTADYDYIRFRQCYYSFFSAVNLPLMSMLNVIKNILIIHIKIKIRYLFPIIFIDKIKAHQYLLNKKKAKWLTKKEEKSTKTILSLHIYTPIRVQLLI